MAGLRDRKKQQTRDALSQAAISLFLERGFDQVTVADIAAAAEVSKPTLFKYFASKQDLALYRIADHEREAARVVSSSEAAPATALRKHFLAGLQNRDPVTGLNDHPEVLAYHRMVFTTPSLVARVHQLMVDDEEALASALGGGLAGELAAAQFVAVQRVLARRNWEALGGGVTADEHYRVARAEATIAFRRLG